MRLDESPQLNVWAGFTKKEKKSSSRTVTPKIFLLYIRLLPTHLQADFIGLTGAEDDLLWHLVFVERDQQARTGSCAEQRRGTRPRNELLYVKQTRYPPHPHIVHCCQRQPLQAGICHCDWLLNI